MRLLLVAAVSLWPLVALAQKPADGERPAIPRQILDPKFPAKPPVPAAELERRHEAERALAVYEAGNYPEAARLGLAELASAPGNHEMRLAVANSLAWTARYDPAVEQYRVLLGTSYDSQARIGIANALRWRGQPDLAEPYYREVLAREPGNEEARNGMALLARDLRPALTLRLTRAADNQNVSRNELSLGYRRWSAERDWRFEVGAFGGRFESPQGSWSPRGIQASAWGTRLPLSPRVEASAVDNGAGGTRGFGTLQLEPIRDRLRIRFGRVDWARLAFTGSALADGLTASVIGAFGETETRIGTVRGRIDHYGISDGNTLIDGELQLTPLWQPLPYKLVWSGGVYGRGAEREDPRYWSPRPTYGVAFLGVQRGWYLERSDVTASVRHGFAFTETARNSWSAALSARYWVRATLALGVEAWAVQAPRPGPYNLHQVGAFLQQLL